ncbi:Retrovirus-related Pol polyprotein from transposon TNT 1-94 [Gossypium australe]|uniref:Retrovirus-related Pol polyprotein from transposon TNT 1-94 n=1 Tax=Gossypium australe TaxID=47621 RepID=A0A5B6VCK4_9ROSI|nr:Retrovirus-related Pol polyprotein from transposon TNT 1-94 [Gossypium australe]
MRKYIQDLEENKTWTVEDLPPGKKAISKGIDFHETFSPTAMIATIRTIIAMITTKNWELHQMDMHNAFLHGDLNEEVYMKMPPGFSSESPRKVCRLRKSLYGLRQAPRCWFAKLVDSLKEYGFHQSCSDYSLFVFHKWHVKINVLIYMDDLIISCNDCKVVQQFNEYLSSCFYMKDLGWLKYFLGIEVVRNARGFFVNEIMPWISPLRLVFWELSQQKLHLSRIINLLFNQRRLTGKKHYK